MTSQGLREAFLDFFEQQQHRRYPSSSLIPQDDPSLLFTNAGMVQFKHCFLGNSFIAPRITTSQRCVRAGGKHNDLDQVGYTARHHTFFEMLGNFSFGDYFKREAIQFAWCFLTQVLHLPPEKLWVTVYEQDAEAEAIWLNELKIDATRFSRCGAASNFWSMGDTGPCGPCTEIFYDHGPEIAGGPPGSPDEDGDRYVEIWNLVFMQYDRSADGTLTPLPKPSVDTGMGLERLTAVMQGVHNNYETDLFMPIIEVAAKLAGITDLKHTSLRVMADHIRACSFLIIDGILPSNEGRGYVLRRIIRRALRHGAKAGVKACPFFYQLVSPLVAILGEAYPELPKNQHRIEEVLKQEEYQFAKTLDQGMRLFEQGVAELHGKQLPGELIFKLYDTYGFPPDLTADMARERDLTLDIAGFEQAMEKQRQQSQGAGKFTDVNKASIQSDVASDFKGYEHLETHSMIQEIFVDGQSVETLQAGIPATLILAETPFYAESGGQVGDTGMLKTTTACFAVEDTKRSQQAILHHGILTQGQLRVGETIEAIVDAPRRDKIRANHSATHLLHSALQQILGKTAEQRGSLVAPDRLRFDFTHHKGLTPAELKAIEDLVNVYIRDNALAVTQVGPIEAAIAAGAQALFGEKYGDTVRSVAMGEVSHELCGGTHVSRTGDIALFKIISESGIASGVRRIEALTGEAALFFIQEEEALLQQAAQQLKVPTTKLVERITQLQEQTKRLERQLDTLQQQALEKAMDAWINQAIMLGSIRWLAIESMGLDDKAVKYAAEQLCQRLGEQGLVFVVSAHGDRVVFAAAAGAQSKNKMAAQTIVQEAATMLHGKGGGRDNVAQGSGSAPDKIPNALQHLHQFVLTKVGT